MHCVGAEVTALDCGCEADSILSTESFLCPPVASRASIAIFQGLIALARILIGHRDVLRVYWALLASRWSVVAFGEQLECFER